MRKQRSDAIPVNRDGRPADDLSVLTAKNRMTRAMSAGLGHFAKSALGMAFLLGSVSMILGRTEFTRTPVPLRSAAREFIIAIAAAFEAA